MKLKLLLSLFVALFMSTISFSQAPINDAFVNAIVVPHSPNWCSSNAVYTTLNATTDGSKGSTWTNGPNYNVWFKFTATTNQINVTVAIGSGKGSQRGTQVAIWNSDGVTEVSSKRYVGADDDVVVGALGLVTGNTYYISVDTYSSGYRGTFTLCLQDKVDYDYYEGAKDLTALINGCSTDAIYDTRGGSPDRNKGANWNTGTGPNYNRWFKFEAPDTGQISVTVDVFGLKGSQTYSQVALWQSDGVTEVKSNRYVSTTDDVTVGALGLIVGAIYYISVDSYNTNTYGTFSLCLQDKVDYDYYEGAKDVTALINKCSADAIYDTRGGTPDRNKGANWNTVSGPNYNRWFKFVAPVSGQINVTVDIGGNKGSQTYSQVALWQFDGITEVKSNRYVSTTDDVTVGALGLTSGAIYYISVDSYNSNTYGTFSLCLQDKVDYDYYEGAIDVTGIINSCSDNAIYDTRGATPDRNKGVNWDTGIGPNYNRWFKFVAPATGQINVKVDVGDSKGTQFYSQLALWKEDGITEIKSNRYVTTSRGDDIIVGATNLMPGDIYYISVDSYNSNTFGTFTLCLQDKVDYDYYEGAIDVTGLINKCSVPREYTTLGATSDKNKGSTWNGGPLYNRWFKFTATTNQINVTVDIGSDQGDQRGTQVAIWNSDGVTEIRGNRYVGVDDDVVVGALGLIPGNVYYISVDTYSSSYRGAFTLCLKDEVDYDYYEGAIDITNLMNTCSAPAEYSTIGATSDKDKGSTWNGGPLYNRWFKFTATTNQINVTVDIGGSKGDQRGTQVAIWNSDGVTEVRSNSYVGINDDVVVGALGLIPGNVYYISVDTYSSSYRGAFTLCLKDEVDYDYYEGAIDVTNLMNTCSAPAEYSTIGASSDKDKGSTWNGGPLYNRWFKFKATTNQINITVDIGSSQGDQRGTQVAIWNSDGVTEVSSNIYVGINDDVVVGSVGLIPGNVYYISVDTYHPSYRGTFTLCLQDKLDYDFYEGAIDVTSLINKCSAPALYTTLGATSDKNKGITWNGGPLYNRWFKFTATTNQINVTVDIGSIQGSQRGTQVAIWSSDGVTEVSSNRYVGIDDDVVVGALGLIPGEMYYVSVDTYHPSYRGTFALCLQDTTDYDFYEGALDISSLINMCSAPASYTTIGATSDKKKGITWNGGPLYNRWFKFTATTNEINITVDIGSSQGSQRGTQVAIWNSDGVTELSSNRYVGIDDDVVVGALGLIPGNVYYVSVDTYHQSYRGTFTLCLQDTTDYDFYEGAIDVTNLINSCSSDALYTTVGATPDKIAGSKWNNSGPKFNRWFKFTAPATGQINITVDVGDAKGTQKRTQIALWKYGGVTEINSTRYVSDSDDVVLSGNGLTPGATYYISVDSFVGYAGTFTLCLENTFIDFNGSNYFVDFGNNHNFTTSFSLESWVFQKSNSAIATVISKGDVKAGANRGYHLSIKNGYPNLTWYNNSGVAILNITSTDQITNNIWHHIATTYNGTTASLYLDGVLVKSGNSTAPLTNTNSFMLGASFDSGTPSVPKNYFNGYIDEVRLWNVALTEKQLREMMNQEIIQNGTAVRGKVIPLNISGSLSWTNLKGYYPMTNNTAVDYSSSKINGYSRNNKSSIQLQTAPLPYVSSSNNAWEIANTWLNNTSQYSPNSTLYGTKIDWNIVRISNNATINSSIKTLGLIIDNGKKVTVTGDNELQNTRYLELNGTLDLEGESQLVQTKESILQVGPNGKMERDQQGTVNLFAYNYWSSPVHTSTGNSIVNGTETYKIQDVLKDGTNPNSPQDILFVAGNDGGTSPMRIARRWMYKFDNLKSHSYSDWLRISENDELQVGVGYTMKGTSKGPESDSQNYVFTGRPNNGKIELQLFAGNDYLIGNPYPSAIDAYEFLLANKNVISGTLYFWEHYGGGSHILAQYQGGYGMYNLSGGTPPLQGSIAKPDPDVSQNGTPTKIPKRYIPVAQGFFVTAQNGGNIKFDNDQRKFITEGKNNQNSIFFRSSDGNNNVQKEEDFRPKFRIGYKSPNNYKRQLLLTIDENASTVLDWGFDGELNEDNVEDMVWVIEGGKYVIQGIDSILDTTVLPLSIKTKNGGLIEIGIDALDNVTASQSIYLKDGSYYHNLRDSSYKTQVKSGTIEDQFQLVFTDQETLSGPKQNVQKDLTMYFDKKLSAVVIQNLARYDLSLFKITNLLGQNVFEKSIKTSEDQIIVPVTLHTNLYIVTLEGKAFSMSQKVLVTN